MNEGSAWSGSGTVTDPGVNDILSGTVDYGDSSPTEELVITDGEFALSHVYADGPADYTVKVTAKDSDGGEAIPVTIPVTVNNVKPTVNAGTNETIAEGDTFNQSGSFNDPGADTWSAMVDWGEGNGFVDLAVAQATKTFALSHKYAQDRVFPVTVKVWDGTVWSSGTTVVTVTANNVAPTWKTAPSDVAGAKEGVAFDR